MPSRNNTKQRASVSEGLPGPYPFSVFLCYNTEIQGTQIKDFPACPVEVISCDNTQELFDQIHTHEYRCCVITADSSLVEILEFDCGVPAILLYDSLTQHSSDSWLDCWYYHDCTETSHEHAFRLLPMKYQQWLTRRWQGLLLGAIRNQDASTFLTSLREYFDLEFLTVLAGSGHEELLSGNTAVKKDCFQRRVDKSFSKSACSILTQSSHTTSSDTELFHGMTDTLSPEARSLEETLRFYDCQRLLLLPLSVDHFLLGAGKGSKQAHHRNGENILASLQKNLEPLTMCHSSTPEVSPRVLLNSLGEAVILCNPDDVILDVNSRALTLTGYSRDELIGSKAASLLHPHSDLPASLNGQPGNMQEYCLPLIQKDGTQRRVRVRATSLTTHTGSYATLASLSDVTEEYITQLRVQQSEKRLRHLFELPLTGIAIFNRSLKLTEANPCLLEQTNSTLIAMHNSGLLSLFPQREVARVERYLAAFIDGTQDACVFESSLLRFEDQPLACSLSLACIRDDDEHIAYYVLLALDISKRKNAERIVRTQKDFLAQVLDTLPHPVFARDTGGRYTLANKAFAQLAGISAGQIVGNSHQELFHVQPLPPAHRHSDRSAVRAGTDGVHLEGPIDYLEHGSNRWYRTIKKPLRSLNAVPHEILGVMIDLTEHKRAERMLRMVVEGTSTSTEESIFDHLVRHIASVLTVDHVYIARFDEHKTETVETISFWKHGSIHASTSFPIADTPLETSIGQPLRYYQRHVQKRFPNDTYLRDHTISCFVGATLYSQHGTPIGVLVVMHASPLQDWALSRWLINIFALRASAELERHDAEQAATHLQSQLLQSQKMDAIGQLAAGVAHDLNNALNAVTGHLELLTVDTTSTEAVQERIALALQGCTRATSLINELLGFARQGRYNVNPQDLVVLTHQTVSFLDRVLGNNIQVHCDVPDTPCMVLVDAAQIQQVLTNLLLNAKQAMPQGGTIQISLSKQYQHKPERYNAKSSTGYFFALSVQDEGSGITKEDLERIFEPFFTTKPIGEGTGLGLAMVYGILQHHDGWVAVESEVDNGSTFTLHLPLYEAAIEHTALPQYTQSTTPIAASSHGRVLVVDDETMLLDLAETFFSIAGLTVDTCAHPKEAVEFFRKHHSEIDLVLLDMNMPDMDGAQCFQALREINPDISAILLSGFIDDESVQQTLEQGALTFFQKPVEYKKLLEWVQEFLQQHGDSGHLANT